MRPKIAGNTSPGDLGLHLTIGPFSLTQGLSGGRPAMVVPR